MTAEEEGGDYDYSYYNLWISITMMLGRMIVFNHPNWPPTQEIDRLFFDRLTEQNRRS